MRDGKAVCIDQSIAKKSASNIRSDEYDRLREQLKRAERNVKEKEAKLDSLNKRYRAHRYLISRNQRLRKVE